MAVVFLNEKLTVIEVRRTLFIGKNHFDDHFRLVFSGCHVLPPLFARSTEHKIEQMKRIRPNTITRVESEPTASARRL